MSGEWYNHKIESQDAQIAELKGQVSDLKSKIQALEGDRNDLEFRLDHMQALKERIEARAQALEDIISIMLRVLVRQEP